MEIGLYKSFWKSIKLILLCSIFVVGGIYLLRSDSTPVWVGWMSIIFFGLGYPVALFNMLDRRPQIVINELGIFDRTIYTEFINWGVIKDAYLLDINKSKFICLVVDENYQPSKKKGVFYKTMADVNKHIGAQELNLNLATVSVNETKLLALILLLIQTRPENRAEKIDIKYLKS